MYSVVRGSLHWFPFPDVGPGRSETVSSALEIITGSLRTLPPHLPLNDTLSALLKQIRYQLQDYLGDNKARLCNLPLDFLPLTSRKIETNKALGVLIAPFWTSQAWFARLKGLTTTIKLLKESAQNLRGVTVNYYWQIVLAEIGLARSGPP